MRLQWRHKYLVVFIFRYVELFAGVEQSAAPVCGFCADSAGLRYQKSPGALARNPVRLCHVFNTVGRFSKHVLRALNTWLTKAARQCGDHTWLCWQKTPDKFHI